VRGEPAFIVRAIDRRHIDDEVLDAAADESSRTASCDR